MWCDLVRRTGPKGCQDVQFIAWSDLAANTPWPRPLLPGFSQPPAQDTDRLRFCLYSAQ